MGAAEAVCREALRREPGDAGALHFLGMLAFEAGRREEGLGLLRRAMEARPYEAQFHGNLGAVLGRMGRHEEALGPLREAVRLRPEYAQGHTNLGAALESVGLFDAAVEAFGKAVALLPGDPQSHVNLANALRYRGDWQAAADACGRALGLDGGHFGAVMGLGGALLEGGKLAQARGCFERAVELRGEDPDAHYSLAVALLAGGEFEAGWRQYAWRRDARRSAHTPAPWRGWVDADLTGRTVLLRGEGGLGNVIQFARYAALVGGRGARVIVECQERLAHLMRRVKGVADVVTMAHEVMGLREDPGVEAVMLRSLPALFGTTLGNMPVRVPYLSADERLVEEAGAFLQTIPGYRVGVCWQGSQELVHRRNRSFPSSWLTRLARVPGVRLVGLQVGAEPDPQLPITLYPNLDQSHGGFMDTAAVIRHLDLVISCDTSVAHLAGALGARVWVALPFAADWRWMADREDSPWYPGMRLFRQPRPGDWGPVFEEIEGALRRNAALADGPSGGRHPPPRST
jgi:Flp pilus assembly protein TadD